MSNKFFFSGILIFFYGCVTAQVKEVSLQKAIMLAKQNSLDYKVANFIAKSAYWNYDAFKASFLPKLSLSGNLPNYYRTINSIILPNGAYDFVSQNVANSNLNLNLKQNIGLTGGSIVASSSLQRIDNFGLLASKQYTSIPISLSYFQENLFYNPLKASKTIEALKLEESKREYIENLEEISYKVVDKYFNLLSKLTRYELDMQNMKNSDTLLKITNSRFEIGTVNLNDVLQAKVSLLNAKKSIANSATELEIAKQEFSLYLNSENIDNSILNIPEKLDFFTIKSQDALSKAKRYRKFNISFKRRLSEAQEAVRAVKITTGPSINIGANLGLTQTGYGLIDSYGNLLRNQSLTIGFSIPIIDWGVNKSNRRRAESNLDLEKTNVLQEELTLEQEIGNAVAKWNLQYEQMTISKETRLLASQRYNIAKQKFSLGTLSYLDFNNAQIEKDQSITEYINDLRDYWSLYYLLRRLTLYDFINNKEIDLIDII